jgi:hypothetical protein
MAMAKTVLQALKEIPDPRKRQGRQYPLYGLLAVLVLAALQGQRSLRGMWQWASGREAEWLSYPSPGFRAVKRIPGLSTFWYALSKLSAGELERALQGLPGAEGELAVDGKRLRGSRREGETALQVIILAGTRLQEVWEQRAGEGGDELGAAIVLLEDFAPEGEVIGADAGLLQASFVQKVMEKRGLHRLDQRQSARVASGDGGLDRFVARPPYVVSCPKGHGPFIPDARRAVAASPALAFALLGIEV